MVIYSEEYLEILADGMGVRAEMIKFIASTKKYDGRSSLQKIISLTLDLQTILQ